MLFSEMSYLDNLCFSLDWRFPTLWMSRRIKRSILREYEPLIGKDIHAQDITHLSPYSLYNLVYYRIHLYHPKVVFLMQPFAGAVLVCVWCTMPTQGGSGCALAGSMQACVVCSSRKRRQHSMFPAPRRAGHRAAAPPLFMPCNSAAPPGHTVSGRAAF